MDKESPVLELKAFVLLLFAVLVGCATGVLTSMSEVKAPQVVIAGGAAAGAAFLWAKSVL